MATNDLIANLTEMLEQHGTNNKQDRALAEFALAVCKGCESDNFWRAEIDAAREQLEKDLA